MLKFFSRMERTRNFVLLTFAIVMVASLVVFYAPTRGDLSTNLTASDETLARVGSETITVGEIAYQQNNFAQSGRPAPTKNLLDRTINERIIRAEANRLGLRATDEEVANYIRQQQRSTPGQVFNQEIYRRNVSEQFGSVRNFEEAVRSELGGKKLQAFLTSGVTVSEEEVLDDYKRRNTKFDLTYVPVSSADLAQTINPSEEELRNYFEQNKKDFYINTPQKNIRYLFINTTKIGERLNISDEDLRTEFQNIPEDKRIAGVEGQQIVFRIPKADLEDQVRVKANEIYTQAIRDGGKISSEAFAELVRGYSEDGASRARNGNLTGLVRENPQNPTDPYQRLLTMQPGEVTEPIMHQDRFFILRRGESVAKSFEDAKKEIDVSLRNRRAYAAAAEVAQKMSDRLRETKDLQATAQEFAAQVNMSPQEMIRETGFVKPGDNVENIGTSPQFEEGIAGLENQSDVGERIPIQNGFAIPMLAEKREPRDAEFSEVREKISETVKTQQAIARVEEIARQIAAGATSAGNLSSAAQGKGLKAQEAKSFVLGSPLGQGPSAATSEALENAIYGLKPGEVTNNPVKIGDNWYVVGVNSREEANMEEFAKERDELFEQKLDEKRAQVFGDYLASKRREMEAAGTIKIYQDAFAKLDTSSAMPDSPQIPPQLQQQILQQQIEQQQRNQ